MDTPTMTCSFISCFSYPAISCPQVGMSFWCCALWSLIFSTYIFIPRILMACHLNILQPLFQSYAPNFDYLSYKAICYDKWNCTPTVYARKNTNTSKTQDRDNKTTWIKRSFPPFVETINFCSANQRRIIYELRFVIRHATTARCKRLFYFALLTWFITDMHGHS